LKKIVETHGAPAAIGPYSQAVSSQGLTFISGQIPLDPDTMELVADEFWPQAHQVFKNLSAVAAAAESSLDACVKLTVYLVDLNDFKDLNAIMAEYIKAPFPARAAVEVAALPRGARIEIDAILTT
jgi:reactive intermediate/imine deaminase